MPVSPEEHLVSSVINNGDIKTAYAHGVAADMFHTCSEEWAWLVEFQNKYKRTPKKSAFMRAFPEFRFRTRSTDTDHFADEVRTNHARHVLAEVLTESAEALASRDIDKALSTITSAVVKVSSSLGILDDEDIFTSYSDVLQNVQDRFNRAETEGSAGIPTGVDSFDELTGGTNPGELVIVSARLGEGKSWVMQSWAAHAAAAGYKVQYDALEQTKAEVVMRIHALISGSSGRKLFQSNSLMKGKGFDLGDYQDFVHGLKKSVPGRMHVADTKKGSLSTMGVVAQIERNNPDQVYIDYITLMKMKGGGRDWQSVNETSTELKQIGQRYGVSMVVAAQLNRSEGMGKGEPPGPEAIGASDGIGQDADIVITQRQRSTSVIQQRMAKNRNGPGNMLWWLQFQPGLGIIKEVSANTAQQLMDADAEEADKAYDKRGRS